MGLIDYFIEQPPKSVQMSHAHTREKGILPSFYNNNPTSEHISSHARVTNGQNESSLQKCLNQPCEHSERKVIDENLVAWPWCGHEKKPVIDMQACPLNLWKKDEKGFPIPESRTNNK